MSQAQLQQGMASMSLQPPPLQRAKRSQRAFHEEISPSYEHSDVPPHAGQQYAAATGNGRARDSTSPQPALPQGYQAQTYQHGFNSANNFPAQSSQQPVQQQQHPYANAPPPTYQNPQQPQQRAGVQPNSARTRIDVDQIPSPVAVQAIDQARFSYPAPYVDPSSNPDVGQGPEFYTCSRGVVPLALTDYIAVDQGNCSPRFMRLTTYTLPNTEELATSAQLPLGLVVQPFADLAPGELPIPIADFASSSDPEVSPPRCKHCRSYINPWVRFIDSGSKFICNLCNGTTDVPSFYYSHLDNSGRRLDLEHRPELCRGTVDFAVPKDYWVQQPEDANTTSSILSSFNQAASSATSASTPSASSSSPAMLAAKEKQMFREPAPISFVFAVDVSWTAARSGMIASVTKGLREVLYGTGEEQLVDGVEGEDAPVSRGSLPLGSRVAILSFDKTVHFYNLKVCYTIAAWEQADYLGCRLGWNNLR